jgi:RimJ/RimL family protein N-acetyltransferase
MPRLAMLSSDDAVFSNLTVVLAPDTGTEAGETFVVERRNDRALIGAGGYRAVPGAATVELGLWIGARDWGRGFGTELAHALIDRAFAHSWVSEVSAVLRVTNGRGRTLLERCGFQFRGTGMARAGHGAFPVERFGLGRRSWTSLKAWGALSATDRDERRRASA